jgi:hypothetical protein
MCPTPKSRLWRDRTGISPRGLETVGKYVCTRDARMGLGVFARRVLHYRYLAERTRTGHANAAQPIHFHGNEAAITYVLWNISNTTYGRPPCA